MTESKNNFKNKLNYGALRKVLYDILENEGIKGLFKGVQMRFIYISIGGMIFFGTNEKMKKLLKY